MRPREKPQDAIKLKLNLPHDTVSTEEREKARKQKDGPSYRLTDRLSKTEDQTPNCMAEPHTGRTKLTLPLHKKDNGMSGVLLLLPLCWAQCPTQPCESSTVINSTPIPSCGVFCSPQLSSASQKLLERVMSTNQLPHIHPPPTGHPNSYPAGSMLVCGALLPSSGKV